MNQKKVYLDMCIECDATPSEEVDDNLDLLSGEFDDYTDSSISEDLPDLYDEAKL